MTTPERDSDLLDGRAVRPLKAIGMIGYVLLLVAIALIAVAVVAATADWALTPWVTAAIVCTVVAVGFLAGSRVALPSRPGHDRAEHDPLIPEVTAEEADDYERRHRNT
ncbi:hypothetical protein GOHSU_13_00160 [Gordonia hirsuta DSM 44140 = NBRC 16056]|uniref:Uncharacterized protein n=1 Tax=Gordonia hirsuta DSM 44140 = NBRC 16056 TaxID=1121927 RepID=L7L779_9ACTN|nr:hypothetical protein [Gordonia hirsuta]GAC56794.1 hypothetical protein GOHSU_13_00160 [Gordonia hirsuta DSM 44140 = NBRC 16056]